jgi:very-short-patch-repair endonuclease
MERKRPDVTFRNLLNNPMKNPQTVEKVAAMHRGRKQSREHVEKRVQRLKILHREHPELWASAYKLMEGRPHFGPKKQSDDTRRLMSQRRKEYLARHPEILTRLKTMGIGKHFNVGSVRSEEARTKSSISLKKTLEGNPELRRRFAETARKLGYNNRGKKRSTEVRKKLSEINKRRWLDEEYVKRFVRVLNLRPNKTELKLQALLNEVAPNDYRYTGDGSMIIGGKLPDFVNANGQKKVIELLGRYWHNPEEVPARMARFKECGWDCLVIWDDEFKNLETLKAKIVNFTCNDETQ